jgi:sulfate permease, SulP family
MPSWFFASLRRYQIGWLLQDLIAGLMLAAIAIPGQLATARLAGMPPETGLYAFAADHLLSLSSGRTALRRLQPTPRLRQSLPGRSPLWLSPAANIMRSLMVGAILVAVGLFRAGWLPTLLSTPVTIGFLAGISIPYTAVKGVQIR